MFVSVKNTFCAVAFMISLYFSSGNIYAAPVVNLKDSAGDSARFITWTYNETPMALYVPKSTGKPLPIVMYLHYCTGNPLYQEFWVIPSLNAIEPCAVFLPTAPALENNCADWGGTYDENLRSAMVNALNELDSLIAGTAFNKNRQYLYGESMGGEGVYRLLMDFPERFAGAVSVVGYTKDKGAENMAETPLWIIHGAKDGTNPVESDRTIYQSILDAGGTAVKYTEYPDLDHVPAMEMARIEPGLFSWLLSNRRTTGIVFRQQNKQAEAFNCNIFTSYKTGKLHFSRLLPQGTVLMFFNLNGKMLYTTVISGKSASLPNGIIRRVSLWQMSNPDFSVSGKIISE